MQSNRSDPLPRPYFPTTINTTATTTTSTTPATTPLHPATATVARNGWPMLPRNSRRSRIPMHFLDDYDDYSSYNRSYMNMYMNGYSPYNAYRQPITNQYKNP